MEKEVIENLVRLSGWVAAGFLFLNFLTCFVMPWAKKCIQLLRKEEGLEEFSRSFCAYHSPFARLAIFFALIHIILAVFLR